MCMKTTGKSVNEVQNSDFNHSKFTYFLRNQTVHHHINQNDSNSKWYSLSYCIEKSLKVAVAWFDFSDFVYFHCRNTV
jgi:hypothetical protein